MLTKTPMDQLTNQKFLDEYYEKIKTMLGQDVENSEIIKSLESIHLLIQSESNPEDEPSFQSYRDRVFVLASENGHLKVVEFLSTHPEFNFGWLRIAFEAASKNGHVDVVKSLYLVFYKVRNYIDVKRTLHLVISLASANGHLDVVKFFSTLPEFNLLVDGSEVFLEACSKGHLKLVEFIFKLPGFDPFHGDNAFISASENGNEDLVKLLHKLLPKISPEAQHEAFKMACAKGHLKVVKLLLELLPEINPAADENRAFVAASVQGRLEVVKFLSTLTKVNPADLDHHALKGACIRRNVDVIKFLLTLPCFALFSDNKELSNKNRKKSVFFVDYEFGDILRRTAIGYAFRFHAWVCLNESSKISEVLPSEIGRLFLQTLGQLALDELYCSPEMIEENNKSDFSWPRPRAK